MKFLVFWFHAKILLFTCVSSRSTTANVHVCKYLIIVGISHLRPWTCPPCLQTEVLNPRGPRPMEPGTGSENCDSKKQWPFCTDDDWVRPRFLSYRPDYMTTVSLHLVLSFIRAQSARQAAGFRVWWTKMTSSCWRRSRRCAASWIRMRPGSARPTRWPNRPTTTWGRNSISIQVSVRTFRWHSITLRKIYFLL